MIVFFADAQVFPQLGIRALAVEEYLDLIAGVDVRSRKKLDRARKQRVADVWRPSLVSFGNDGSYSGAPRYGEKADQHHYEKERDQDGEEAVFENCHRFRSLGG